MAVIGSGSWATAIVKILLNNVDKVYWWVREEEIMTHLNTYNHNPNYLSSVSFDSNRLIMSMDVNEILRAADIPVVCIPSAFLDASLIHADPALFAGKPVVSAIKGIVPESREVVADYFQRRFGVSPENFVVVSGPSHAEEVAQEKLAYLTVTSTSSMNATAVSGLFSCRYIKTSISDDVAGAEYAPVLKNVFAIASGICSGLGYGDNFQAVLISNALQEMSCFMDAISPGSRDIKKSLYLGDLLVTCYSQFSRNRRFGTMLAKGYSPRYAQMEMQMVAEGYYAAKCIWEINQRYGIDLPITRAVYNILYENQSARSEIRALADKLS